MGVHHCHYNPVLAKSLTAVHMLVISKHLQTIHVLTTDLGIKENMFNIKWFVDCLFQCSESQIKKPNVSRLMNVIGSIEAHLSQMIFLHSTKIIFQFSVLLFVFCLILQIANILILPAYSGNETFHHLVPFCHKKVLPSISYR